MVSASLGAKGATRSCRFPSSRPTHRPRMHARRAERGRRMRTGPMHGAPHVIERDAGKGGPQPERVGVAE